MESPTLISIVVPTLNESGNISRLYERVRSVFDGMDGAYDFEIVFTDNHSDDSTFSEIAALAAKDPRIRGYRFSRNFGFQRSILEGYRRARGAAAIQLDADMQDPPELIPVFIDKWREGYQVVYGVRKSRPEAWYLRGARKAFYRTIDALSEDHLPQDAGDFRLVDRCILDVLRRLQDAQPYLRGTIAAMGFEQIGVPYERASRDTGESKFRFNNLAVLAVDGILNHSIVPLRLATFTGIGIAIFTLFAIIAFMIGRFLLGRTWPAGFATTTALILIAIALNGLFLGVIGEYLGRIYKQVKLGPNTIIEQRVDHHADAYAEEFAAPEASIEPSPEPLVRR